MNDRKQHVLLTAQRIFVNKGFSTTSVQDILDESGISKGTFYNYFSSKNECLIAILEHAHNEATVRRQELLISGDISSKDVLIEQILVRMQVNREQNLIPLFETIFHSGDSDLRAFVKKNHLIELSWLSRRLIDIYGKDAMAYSFDCAVLTLGMIQHMMHVWKAGSKEDNDIDTAKLVHFIFRQMDVIIANMISTKDVLLGDSAFFISIENVEVDVQTKQQLLVDLVAFKQTLEDNTNPKGIQYLQFLIDELQVEQPKIFLIETILRSFREAFSKTSHEPEARELAFELWRYVSKLAEKS